MCLRGASLCAFLDRVWQLIQCRDQTVSPKIRYVRSNSYYLVSESVCVCVLALTMPKCKANLCACRDGEWLFALPLLFLSLLFSQPLLFLPAPFPSPGETAVGKSSLVLRFVKGQFNPNQEVTIGGER